MAIQLSVQVRNAKLVQQRFEDLSGEFKLIGRERLYKRMLAAQRTLKRYPAPYAGEPPHRPWTPKQRRYVMWAIREGIIKFPYVRTGRYGARWELRKTEDGYLLRNLAPYAKWVAGGALNPDIQAAIHKTRWPQFRTAMEFELYDLPEEIQNNVIIAARRRGF